MARQNTAANPVKPGGPLAAAASYAGVPQAAPSLMPQQHQPPPSHALAAPPTYPPTSQSVLGAAMPFSLPPMPGHGAQPPAMPAAANNPYAAPAPAPGPSGVGLDSITQQQIVLIKALADQGVPFDKIPALIQSMTGASSANLQTAFQAPVPAAQGSYPTGQQPWGNADSARDRGLQDGSRSPNRYLGRSRSRSPDRGWGARGSPRGGHDRLDYGHHEERERNGRRGNGYRQRSPQGRRGRSSTPSSDLPKIERWIEFDPTLPAGHIKVLSRTLFVGGVT